MNYNRITDTYEMCKIIDLIGIKSKEYTDCTIVYEVTFEQLRTLYDYSLLNQEIKMKNLNDYLYLFTEEFIQIANQKYGKEPSLINIIEYFYKDHGMKDNIVIETTNSYINQFIAYINQQGIKMKTAAEMRILTNNFIEFINTEILAKIEEIANSGNNTFYLSEIDDKLLKKDNSFELQNVIIAKLQNLGYSINLIINTIDYDFGFYYGSTPEVQLKISW